ncbi:concanavalin A-like lectin/glucanase domain-containing protein [Dichotomopilus funicola]|uniref:Concanavalin A-like lectin/glucanase domain-containing protein n=1 Tax=Dichotomopilus funicola TaxID=1934379 RepID=A0AAN6ZQI9_9PEZI|nr:concanavalin A-like lectin/glucanase domain-containing protein [Dichotomopilus funicola]
MPSTNLLYHLLLAVLIPITTAFPIPLLHPRQSVATLCSETGYWSGSGYEVNNNNWGASSATSGSQCTYVDSASSSGVAWHTTWTWEGGETDVKSFAYSGLQVERGHTIAAIGGLETEVKWAYNTTEGVRANVAYDFFTDEDPERETTGGDYELMLWLAKYGDIQPIGSTDASATLAGHDWDYYVGNKSDGMRVYSFVAISQIDSFSGDIKEFFDYVTDHDGFPAETQNLIVFDFGSEAFTGGPTELTVSSFTASMDT